jgi:ferredoxin
VQIDTELCAGCGACIDSCPSGAISLQAKIATIDRQRCNECQACIEVCPTGAITADAILPVPTTARPEIMVQRSNKADAPGRLTTLAGAGLAYLGREIGPRLVDAFFNALEQRSQAASEPVFTPYREVDRSAMCKQDSRRQIRKRKRQRAARRS